MKRILVRLLILIGIAALVGIEVGAMFDVAQGAAWERLAAEEP